MFSIRDLFYCESGGANSGLVTKVLMVTTIACVGAIMYNGFENTIDMISNLGSGIKKDIKSEKNEIKEEAKDVEKGGKAIFS